MKQARDPELLETARREGRVVVTDDLDFGELVYHQRLATQGVLLLRLRGASVPDRIQRPERCLGHRREQSAGPLHCHRAQKTASVPFRQPH